MSMNAVIEKTNELVSQTADMLATSEALRAAAFLASQEVQAAQVHGPSPLIEELTVFALAVFVGYYVVWRVTPALHSPLMAVTNAISSVIIVGALLAAGVASFGGAKILGLFAVVLAAINIFGGFVVTQRMLQMFMKKK